MNIYNFNHNFKVFLVLLYSQLLDFQATNLVV